MLCEISLLEQPEMSHCGLSTTRATHFGKDSDVWVALPLLRPNIAMNAHPIDSTDSP